MVMCSLLRGRKTVAANAHKAGQHAPFDLHEILLLWPDLLERLRVNAKLLQDRGADGALHGRLEV